MRRVGLRSGVAGTGVVGRAELLRVIICRLWPAIIWIGGGCRFATAGSYAVTGVVRGILRFLGWCGVDLAGHVERDRATLRRVLRL